MALIRMGVLIGMGVLNGIGVLINRNTFRGGGHLFKRRCLFVRRALNRIITVDQVRFKFEKFCWSKNIFGSELCAPA